MTIDKRWSMLLGEERLAEKIATVMQSHPKNVAKWIANDKFPDYAIAILEVLEHVKGDGLPPALKKRFNEALSLVDKRRTVN